MANSASDARGSEQDIRRCLIEDRSVDVIVAVSTNMFYTVTLPVTLWFLDAAKHSPSEPTKFSSLTVARYTTRSTGPTETGHHSKRSFLPISFAYGEAKSQSLTQEVRSYSAPRFPVVLMSILLAYAASRPLNRSRSRAGA